MGLWVPAKGENILLIINGAYSPNLRDAGFGQGEYDMR
jgi:hypothetical protein